MLQNYEGYILLGNEVTWLAGMELRAFRSAFFDFCKIHMRAANYGTIHQIMGRSPAPSLIVMRGVAKL